MKNDYEQTKLLKVHPTNEERIQSLKAACWLLSFAVLALLAIIIATVLTLK